MDRKEVFAANEKPVSDFLHQCSTWGLNLSRIFKLIDEGPTYTFDVTSTMEPSVPGALRHWFSSNKNQERLALAYINGWVVEEERYRFKVIGFSSEGGQQYLSRDNYQRVFSASFNDDLCQEFTQDEFESLRRKYGWNNSMFKRILVW